MCKEPGTTPQNEANRVGANAQFCLIKALYVRYLCRTDRVDKWGMSDRADTPWEFLVREYGCITYYIVVQCVCLLSLPLCLSYMA